MTLELQAKQRNITLHVKVNPKVPKLLCADMKRLQQVLFAVVLNAI